MSEQNLQGSEAILRAIMESSTDHILLVDPAGRIQFINRTVSDLSVDEVMGQPVFNYVAPQFHSRMKECFSRVHDTREPGRYDVDYYNAKEQLVQSFESRVSPVIQDGKVTALTITSTDITTRKQMQEELRVQQDRLAHVGRVSTMGEMAAGIAHEVSQPLSAIANFAAACKRLAGAERVDRERLTEWLQYIGDEAIRVGEIVQGLRSFVTKSSPEQAAHDVCQIIQKAMTLMEAELRQRQVQTEVVANEEITPVPCDEVQIQQVLINLLKNASDALRESDREQRRVRIATHDRGDCVEIVVTDNGPGFSHETADQMFDCFYSHRPGGMGMGLAISRTIVEGHGGRIWSETPNTSGATFHFTLPKSASAATRQQGRSKRA